MRITRLAFVWCLCSCASFAQLVVRPLLNLPGETMDPNLSPDGKTLAFTWFPPDESKSVDPGIYLQRVGGGTPQRFDVTKTTRGAGIDEIGLASSPHWSPDGKWIAFTRSGTPRTDYLRIQPVTGGDERGLGTVTGGSLAWSADGSAVIAAGYFGPDSENQDVPEKTHLAGFPVTPGKIAWRLAQQGFYPAVSPDGKTVAYVRDGGLFTLPLTPDGHAAGSEKTVVKDSLGAGNPVWISNREIAYSAAREAPLLHIVEAHEAAKPRDVGTIDGDIFMLARSSAERTVLATYRAHDDSYWRVDLKAAHPRLKKIRQLPWNTWRLRLTPDGKQVLYGVHSRGKSQMLVSNLDGTNTRQLFELDYAGIGGIEFSPDGRQFAFTAQLREMKSGWDRPSIHLFVASLSSNAPRRLLLPQYEAVILESWSGEGKIVVSTLPEIKDPNKQEDSMELEVDATSGASRIGRSGLPPTHAQELLAALRSTQASLVAVAGDNEVYYISRDSTAAQGVLDLGANGQNSGSVPPAKPGLNLYRFDPKTSTSRMILNVGFAPQMQLSADQRFLYLERHELAQQQAVTIQGVK